VIEGEISDDLVEDVRLCIYDSLRRHGRLPDTDRLIEMARSTVRLADILRALHKLRHVVLDRAGNIVLAHPFATRSFGFSVMSTDTLWWGGCAWDSFALPHLIGVDDVLVATRCPACDRALSWVVGRALPPDGREIAHFLVPAARMWDDVVETCSNQLLFCGHECVDRWLAHHQHPEGYRMPLETLWNFAAHWYDGRLERGYRRRDPTDAANYLGSVGLTGPFWGL